jgi:hypothetical protein
VRFAPSVRNNCGRIPIVIIIIVIAAGASAVFILRKEKITARFHRAVYHKHTKNMRIEGTMKVQPENFEE